MGRRLRIRPNTSGLCTTTQAVSVVDQGDDVFGAARRHRRARDLARQAGHGFHRFGIMGMQAAGQDRLAAGA